MQTRTIRLLITIALSVGFGLAVTGIIASSENGYTAGFAALPLLFLELVACIVSVIVGIVFLIRQNLVCVYFFLAALLLPTASIGSALLAKQFEIGAYKVEPMRTWTPTTANKIVFKKGVTDREVQEFWSTVLATPTERGDEHIAGVQTVATGSPIDGHEVLAFSFYDNATEEAKATARLRILNSPKVEKLIEDGVTFPSRKKVSATTQNPDSTKIANVR
jgi:hypothetical protein